MNEEQIFEFIMREFQLNPKIAWGKNELTLELVKIQLRLLRSLMKEKE